MTFPTSKSEVVSLVVEGILYGLYFILFACTIYVLIYRRSTQHVHYSMFAITLLMFALATTHLFTNLARVLQAFDVSQTRPGSAGIILGNYKGIGNLVRNSVLLTEILLGDLVLIYRCYVAWNGRYHVLIIPIITVLGSGATSGGIIYSFATAPTPQSNIVVFKLGKLQHFILATQALVLFNNIYCTGLLSWKLWRMSRALLSRSQRRSLRSVAKIILQSGLITTVTWIIWMILTLLRLPAHIIILNSLAPITGATFCLIVSRVALGMSSEKTADELPRIQIDRSRGNIVPVLDGTGRRHRALQINISSRESVRVEASEMDTMYKDKMALAGLPSI